MINYLKNIRHWYEFRETREKLLFTGLCWVAIYALFSFAFLTPLEKRHTTNLTEIKAAEDEIKNWDAQIAALNKIPESPLYKKWIAQEKTFNVKRTAYRSLLRSTSNINWEDIIKSILFSNETVTIVQIKNSPEEPYQIQGIKTPIPIYQQKLVLIIYSNYFDTLDYIKKLQNALPTIRWNSLKYEVQEYPSAKIEMEFSVLYEKT
jgi:MSHA biogenesis protein MshJ